MPDQNRLNYPIGWQKLVRGLAKMAAPVKDGKVWRHRVMVSGTRYSGTFDTKAQALAWEADKRVNGGVQTVITKTCRDAFEKYELEVSKGKAGYRWEALRLAAMGRTKLGDVRVCDLATTHVAEWRDERLRSVSGATVNREMNLLSAVFSIARKEWRWIAESPTRDVRRPKDPPPRSRLITAQEVEAICLALGWAHDAADRTPTTKAQRVACAFLWAIETAMRAGEICGLTAASVSGRVAHLSKTKNGDARDVPLSPRALEIWAMVPAGFDLTTATLDALFRKYRDMSGVEGVTFHDTRHLATTRLARKLHVLELARMTGHRDIRELMTYYNESAHDTAGKL
ncbi:tyrosine-type recombinase/integrase [Janthinobacterium sp. CG_S6]|uniref:tyrosine-type recombinase/integrase n=1 Tax=Janthinobacterium sp. CG_S6 TaxID=3071707 RepID=UPI002DF94B7A|nr:integrase [Janthinobacterium sp. CG_S6]